MIASGINFARKVDIFFSTENIKASLPNEERTKLLGRPRSKVRTLSNKRNIIAHSSFFASEQASVVFRRVVASGRLRVEDIAWTEQVFRSDFSEAETPVVDLRRIIEDNVPYVISFDFTNPRNLVIA